MAVQQGASDLKVFSSVRPLQIQRSIDENDVAGHTSPAVGGAASPTPILISSGSQQSGLTIRSSATPVANSAPHQPVSTGVSSGIVIRSAATNQPQPGTTPVAIISAGPAANSVPQRPVTVLHPSSPSRQPRIEYIEEEGPKEFYEEETKSLTAVSIYKPMTPTELLQSLDPYKVFIFAFAVLGTSFLCILTEEDISLAWILLAVSLLSVGAFFKLKL